MQVGLAPNNQFSVPLNDYQPVEFEDRTLVRAPSTNREHCLDLAARITCAVACLAGGETLNIELSGLDSPHVEDRGCVCPGGCCCNCCCGLSHFWNMGANMVAPTLIAKQPRSRKTDLILMALGIAILWVSFFGGGKLMYSYPGIAIPLMLGGSALGGFVIYWRRWQENRYGNRLPVEMTENPNPV